MSDQSFHKELLDHLSDGVYFVDRDRKITYWNRAAESISGFAAGSMVGSHCWENTLIHVDDAGRRLCFDGCPVIAAMTECEPQSADVYLRHKDGHRVPVAVRVSPVRDESGAVIGAVEVFNDNSTKMDALNRVKELENEVLLCPLTGVGNRRYGEIRLDARLDELRRYGWPFGVMFVDIDHFKRVNDSHGHAVGDDALKVVAKTLVNSLRSFDFLARWGGEEFVAIVVNVTEERLSAVAERSRVLVEHSGVRVGAEALQITVSIGATSARSDDTRGSLIERADRAMFASKESGRNRVTVA